MWNGRLSTVRDRSYLRRDPLRDQTSSHAERRGWREAEQGPSRHAAVSFGHLPVVALTSTSAVVGRRPWLYVNREQGSHSGRAGRSSPLRSTVRQTAAQRGTP